jgi:hypothetical protein
LAK